MAQATDCPSFDQLLKASDLLQKAIDDAQRVLQEIAERIKQVRRAAS